ncbi:Retrovirus-related Pol polyprotein from transposon 17.6 [Vitis vinifera]|uniref:Retrovirus-related Pol polyprotein from transposon 17.6 n=1 Tax=Vitis vinifera TaxID=29760 RepID=A0A438ECK3_VITVI|nr:Retrovirus-related Pol polyprotein from transposon 17.6 [Vitis vinifera]
MTESSPTESKGKKPSGGQRSRDVGAISSAEMRPPKGYQTIGKTFGFYYPPSPQVQKTSYIIPSTPSPIDYYSFYIEVDTIVLQLVGYSGHRVPSVLLDNDLALNVCLLATTIAFGFSALDFGPSTQTVNVLRNPTSFNLLLGRPWIHRAGAIPSFLHQKVKFIHDGWVIIVQYIRDMLLIPSQYLRSATMKHSSTMVLDMMRGMSFLPKHGLGLCQQGPNEFIAAIDHDTTFGLGFVPTEVDYRYMARLRKEKVRVIKETQTIPIPKLLEDDDKDSFDHDSNPINERVSLVIEDAEAVDFGTKDQPKELKIGSLLSTYKSDRLIHLLRPVKQKLRRLHPCWSLQVKEKIQKQLSVEFILVVEYLEWLANVILVPKKDGKVRVCVDFEDLNKSSPKDDFPLPHIDLLGYAIWVEDIRATYQRAATTLFHDMMHRNVEVYVDDMIVKSRGQADHLAALERFFERIQKFRLRLNPNKCTFGVTSRKLLGHMVSERGIEVEPDKIKAILDMLVSRTEKDIRGFLSRLQYINRFIARLTNILPPLPGHPLLLYFSVSDMALVSMLAQLDDSRNERLGHYMTEYSVHLISCLDPLRYLINRPALTAYQSGYGIGVLLVSPQGDHISRAQNQFFDALATLASSVDIPIDVVVHPLLNELRSTPAYYCLIGETEKCPECQIHGDLFHAPLLELYALTLPWPFLVWGIDVIRKISPKSSNGHEFILVAIDYFTKWVEFATYARLTSARVASFIRSHIIFHYRVPHELISDRGVHFRAEIDTLLQRYNI